MHPIFHNHPCPLFFSSSCILTFIEVVIPGLAPVLIWHPLISHANIWSMNIQSDSCMPHILYCRFGLTWHRALLPSFPLYIRFNDPTTFEMLAVYVKQMQLSEDCWKMKRHELIYSEGLSVFFLLTHNLSPLRPSFTQTQQSGSACSGGSAVTVKVERFTQGHSRDARHLVAPWGRSTNLDLQCTALCWDPSKKWQKKFVKSKECVKKERRSSENSPSTSSQRGTKWYVVNL